MTTLIKNGLVATFEGGALAGRIIEWRTAHGRFGSVDELRDVPGIGDRTFATLSPRVRV